MNARRHLLLVDDREGRRSHPASAAVLMKLLSREGHAARRATGAEALRQASGERPPDLVLWSARPDARFGEALRALKASADPRFLPVILLPTEGGPEARVSGLRAGADDVMPDCGEEEVLARVASLLRIKAAQDALQHAKAELERQSITDPLTGLFNRRYFGYRLQQELERGRRYGEQVSLLMLDLDHFKRVNDRYGHRTGDEALRRASEVLRSELRRVDVCTRWGGEELAVIMPNTSETGAMVVARRVLRALRSRAVLESPPMDRLGAAPETIRITASLGLATTSGELGAVKDAEEAELLVQRADAAVYRAKAEGRDRICTAPPVPVMTDAAAVIPLAAALPRLAAVT